MKKQVTDWEKIQIIFLIKGPVSGILEITQFKTNGQFE